MKTWVHRIEKDSGFQFLTNKEFAKYFLSGEYKNKDDGWLPFKIDISDSLEPIESKDGAITIKNPDDPSERLKLMDILVSDSTGRPCLRIRNTEELMPLDEVLY